jgi:hypothetical protein
MHDLDEKKWRRFDLAVGCMFDVLAIFIAEQMSERFFGGSFAAGAVIVVIAAVLLNLIKSPILTAVSRSAPLRKFFETK